MASENIEEETRDKLMKQVMLDVEDNEYIARRKRDKLFRIRSLLEGELVKNGIQFDKSSFERFFYYAGFKERTNDKVMEILGSDWLYLALLGLLMGIFSFSIDVCIEMLRHCKQ